MKLAPFLIAIPVLVSVCAAAQVPANRSPVVITPVFHQLVSFTLPPGFQVNAPEQVTAKAYLRESVLKGETPERWTQMITLSGSKGTAAAGQTAQHMIENFGNSFKSACPQTFAIKPLGPTQVSGQSAFVTLIGCGRVADQGGAAGRFHSETALIVAIAGSEDMYTVQWAERARASDAPLPFDEAKWNSRLAALQPVRVCARVEGEQAPYPSCLGK